MLVFHNTYDSSVTAAYQTAILAAEDYFESHFTNAVTINLRFSMKTGNFVASNSPSLDNISLNDLLLALANPANVTSDDDRASVDTFKPVDTFLNSVPTQGAGFLVARAEEK